MLNLKGLSDESAATRTASLQSSVSDASGALHLGAHLGQEAPAYAAAGLAVVWVEALPHIYERLAARLKSFPRQRALCAVLGDVDGKKVSFNVSNNWEGVSSSLFEFGPYAAGEKSLWPELDLKMIDRIELEMTTLDHLLERERVDPAAHDHWSLDLQGAELLALKGAARAVASCRSMLVEVSSARVYQGGVLYDEVAAHLRDCGFLPAWMPEKTHDEVLFLRR